VDPDARADARSSVRGRPIGQSHRTSDRSPLAARAAQGWRDSLTRHTRGRRVEVLPATTASFTPGIPTCSKLALFARQDGEDSSLNRKHHKHFNRPANWLCSRHFGPSWTPAGGRDPDHGRDGRTRKAARRQRTGGPRPARIRSRTDARDPGGHGPAKLALFAREAGPGSKSGNTSLCLVPLIDAFRPS
jgi:hypothetical protein